MKRTLAGLLVFASALVSTSAFALPTSAQRQAIRSSCADDYKTYCSTVPPGGMASLQCLQKNLANLAPACQQAVNAVSGG